ncbi:two-component system, OmpR family, response regulator CssR [Paenibacillus sp. UNCCL117]|uniref:response regulator transcription factor n=1 Tax=unclassified Paenibacillus TaxID=185978 RepID=UPI000881F4CA|nr:MULTISPECIES: response regulator transcription factor [unclassified Paenibacillus]SDD14877.1 two-component system, OmpR family, response regulator CssR [Paenibacillus sp. cl123]SFW34326.1 two-component system, OmpR family, response regulator CssR [Paenibacillus sp. UNCCL117]
MYRVYLVEDEEHLQGVLTAYMEKEGWQVRSFSSGVAAQAAIGERPDLWVLDIMLPGGVDGYQLVREIKADRPLLPVIFISARDADIDRIVGLELGSDDYLAKPFLPRELVVRMRKLLERVYGYPAGVGGTAGAAVAADRRTKIQLSPYTINESARIVEDGSGQPIELTSKEFELLLYLSRHSGQVLEREQVLAAVWGTDYYGSDRVVDDLVRRLRRKLPEMRLETVYGFGYRMVKT